MPGYQQLEVRRLGNYVGRRSPGLTIVIPFIEQVTPITRIPIEALDLDDKALENHIRANVYFNDGDFEAAITYSNSELKLDPNSARAYFTRGGAHLALGDLEAALADYERVLELDPGNALATSNRELVYEKLDDTDAPVTEALE